MSIKFNKLRIPNFGIALLFLSANFLCACNNGKSQEIKLSENDCAISKNLSSNDIGLVEGLYATNSDYVGYNIVLLDYHNENSFSLINTEKENEVIRFGKIGHGAKEIPIGCTGHMTDSSFIAFSDELHCIVEYNLKNINYEHNKVHKYDLEDTQFTQIVPVDSSRYIGMGTYKDEYQYVLFDKKNNVIDYALHLYNYDNPDFNSFHKFLSNQGRLAKHPTEPKFAAVVYNSRNIDFFEVNDSINCIKSSRELSPNYECVTWNGCNRVLPANDTPIGFIDVCANQDFVFALYSESELVSGEDSSDMILVYNWDGVLCANLTLPNKVKYIAATNDMLFIIMETNNGEYMLKGYRMSSICNDLTQISH